MMTSLNRKLLCLLIIALNAPMCRRSKVDDVSPEDKDGDGYPSWQHTANPARADCDDDDPKVTPTVERLIPAGWYFRGSEANKNTTPLRKIWLPSFCMDVFEVTNEQFVHFLKTRKRDSRDAVEDRELYDFEDHDDPIMERLTKTRTGYTIQHGYERHPVNEVFITGATSFCKSVGKRLPTEAEWEKGARGSDSTRTYPWGEKNPDCSLLNYSVITYTDDKPTIASKKSCHGDTRPVGSYPSGQSPYGLMDMAGNVSEFVQDWYQEDYYKHSTNINPRGPAKGFARDELNPDGMIAILSRGGSHASDHQRIQTYARHPEPLAASSNGIGFRCVRYMVASKKRR